MTEEEIQIEIKAQKIMELCGLDQDCDRELARLLVIDGIYMAKEIAAKWVNK